MIRIGVVSPAEIAYRRFLPALKKTTDFEYVGIAIYNSEERFGQTLNLSEEDKAILAREEEKGANFIQAYGGKLYHSYAELISSDDIDAVYIPLPPALHDKYACMALEQGKHVFIEKPASVSQQRTEPMVMMAKERGLALHENYMFAYHSQLQKLKEILDSGKIGNVRLYSLKFGFPKRAEGDFRYRRDMGGGSLLDAGGYTVKLASILLGESAKAVCAVLNEESAYDVDLYGSATLVNEEKVTVQAAFGMDNDYKCEMEIWGSLGSIKTERIFTAPPGFHTTAKLHIGNQEEILELTEDDAFLKSIEAFRCCVEDDTARENAYRQITQQARLVEQIVRLGQQTGA